ncbi:MAG: hypothetical protein B7Z12_20690 [Caulobacter vibrioides]|uniref:Uncharacterized protein n=1 Tax=Caulobacter vibrioides TaxID=155892 RepID=A0A258CQU9_CAUVI|nr:MAG: hypothetical protein B7Z12_20690 [Caulobacter vibrioides]
MIRAASLTAVCVAAGLAGPADAYTRRDESWGKAGISFLQYRTDAVECAYLVETKAPVSIPQVDLTFAIDMPTPGGAPVSPETATADLSAVVDYAAQYQMRMNKHWRRVSQQLEPAMATCLKARGYQRFRLTGAQTAELKRLPAGTRGRQVYLWRVAVDRDVLATQTR